MYLHTHTHTYTHTHTHTHRKRETETDRERERERNTHTHRWALKVFGSRLPFVSTNACGHFVFGYTDFILYIGIRSQ